MKSIRLIVIAFLLMLPFCLNAQDAKTAKQILDKTAANISYRGGVQANFHAVSGKYGSTSGSIAIKGKKFRVSTSSATSWYDGKTQWTYLSGTHEVNVSNPNQAQQMRLNPYSFINVYKKGYRLSSKPSSGGWQIDMRAIHPGSSLQEVVVNVNRSYQPTKISFRQGKQWTYVTVSGFRKSKLPDSAFRFNSKDYPKAEIIDLR